MSQAFGQIKYVSLFPPNVRSPSSLLYPSDLVSISLSFQTTTFHYSPPHPVPPTPPLPSLTHSLTLFPCLPHSPPLPSPLPPSMRTLASSPGYETQGKKSAQDLSYRQHPSRNLQSSIQFCFCKGVVPPLVAKFVLCPSLWHKFIMVCKKQATLKDSTWTAYMDFFFLFWKRGGGVERVCLSEETAKQEGREGKKKRTGWRDMKERNPHPSLFLYALTGKYLNY